MMEAFHNFIKLTNTFYLGNKNDRFNRNVPQYIFTIPLFGLNPP